MAIELAVVKRLAVSPIETIVSVAKVEVSRAGGQAVCFLEALCTKVRHAQRSKEVGGFSPSRFSFERPPPRGSSKHMVLHHTV